MNRKTYSIIAAAIAVILLWPLADRSMSLFAQATTVITNERIPFEGILYGGDCIGEDLSLSFIPHFVTHTTIDPNRILHLKIRYNLSSFKAEGVTTGIKYQGSENLNQVYVGSADQFSEPPWEMTFNYTTTTIGQGSAPNFRIKVRVHVTVNANGETTSSIDRTSITCE
jgi:hypothetical protein